MPVGTLIDLTITLKALEAHQIDLPTTGLLTLPEMQGCKASRKYLKGTSCKISKSKPQSVFKMNIIKTKRKKPGSEEWLNKNRKNLLNKAQQEIRECARMTELYSSQIKSLLGSSFSLGQPPSITKLNRVKILTIINYQNTFRSLLVIWELNNLQGHHQSISTPGTIKRRPQ